MAQDDGSGGQGSGSGWYAVRYAQQVLAQPPPPEAGMHGFTVDPERAQEAIDRLTEIVERLRRWVVGGNGLVFAAPSEDEVSLNLARNGYVMAERAEAGVLTWSRQLEAFRDGLQAQLDAYRQADDETLEQLT